MLSVCPFLYSQIVFRVTRGGMGMNHFLRGKKDSELDIFGPADSTSDLGEGLVVEPHRYVRSFNHFLRGRRSDLSDRTNLRGFLRGKKAPAGMNHFLRGKKAPGMDHFLRGRKAGLNHFLRGKKSSFNHFLRGKKDIDDSGLVFYSDDNGSDATYNYEDPNL